MANLKKADPPAPIAKPTPEEMVATLREAFGQYVERVDPKDFIGDNDPSIDLAQKLISGEITDWEGLAAIFGAGKRYADKAALAASGTPFRITRVVERVRGSFNKEDDWAFEIVTDDGEVQVLSMDRNAQRDIMVYVLVGGLQRFGTSVPITLASYELPETDDRPAGRIFYAFQYSNPSGPRYAGSYTIDA